MRSAPTIFPRSCSADLNSFWAWNEKIILLRSPAIIVIFPPASTTGTIAGAEICTASTSLFYVHAHFFFFSKSPRKKAQVFEPLFIRIVNAGGALKHIVGCPKPTVRIGRGSANNRCFLYDDRLQTAVCRPQRTCQA